MRKDFYLHKRKNGFYYVEFTDKVTGEKMSARSTGETALLKAQVKAESWLLNGVPTGRLKKIRPVEQAAGIESIIRSIGKAELNADDALRIVEKLKNMGLIDILAVKNNGAGAVKFIDHLKEFWDYEKSPYIKSRLSHGKKIGRNHAHQCMLKVNSVLTEFFGDKKLNCVTTDDLGNLTDMLHDRGLAKSTSNQILLCAVTPLKWAYKRKMIPADPSVGLEKINIENRERGILTEEEVGEVLRPEHWRDERAFVASFLSCATGMRQGEILALRPSSIIADDMLKITNSYSRLDGLKCPKNTKKRPAFLDHRVKQYLLGLLKKNPHNGIDDPFFFYSLQPDKPCDCKVLLDGLREVLDKVGIDWKTRNITFHSWRHWNSTLADKNSDVKKAMAALGHLTASAHKGYFHVDENDIREVGQAMGKVFDNILLFKKAG